MEIQRPERDNPTVSRAPAPTSPDRRLEAATRLRHDLGKAVRFSAPAGGPPESADALRARLIADLLETRNAPGETLDAPAVFDRWIDEDGSALDGDPEAAARLERIRAAIDAMRPRLTRLRTLEAAELRELDDAARVVDEETRALRGDLARAAREAI